jgi:peptidoglycan-N-acetylglucosamine deacetylase
MSAGRNFPNAGGDPRSMRGAALSALCLCGVALAVACSGPDLKPTASAAPPTSEYTPVIPTNGECAPATQPSQPMELEVEGPPTPTSPECPGGAPVPSQFNPLRPLGVGYQDGDNPIPPRVAYLTFDDGPSEWTHTFLDILRDKNVKATFFVTAKQLKGDKGLDGTFVDNAGRTVAFRDLLERIVDEGHALGNHTVNHPDLARITRAQVTSEIEQNELLINRALVRNGNLPRLLPLFRPPYGSPWYTGIVAATPPRASERISSHGLNIMWNITSTDAADWAIDESYSNTATPVPTEERPTYDQKVARIKASVLGSRQVQEGAGFIVLMHDTHNATRDALPEIIDGLFDAGYEFQTIDHYVDWRWHRPAIELTPGPSLYDACVDERNWGCEAFGAPVGTDGAREVCGRMWLAFQSLGGQDVVGAPIEPPIQNPDTGILSQAFDRAIIELHPENEAPCNVVVIPQ